MFSGFPGNIDPRMMRQAMKKIGIQETELSGVREVIIRCSDKEIIIRPAEVSRISAMGNVSWQVQGTATERSLATSPSISEEDIETVMQQANVDKKTAQKAIEKCNGDLAAAIIELTQQDK